MIEGVDNVAAHNCRIIIDINVNMNKVPDTNFQPKINMIEEKELIDQSIDSDLVIPVDVPEYESYDMSREDVEISEIVAEPDVILNENVGAKKIVDSWAALDRRTSDGCGSTNVSESDVQSRQKSFKTTEKVDSMAGIVRSSTTQVSKKNSDIVHGATSGSQSRKESLKTTEKLDSVAGIVRSSTTQVSKKHSDIVHGATSGSQSRKESLKTTEKLDSVAGIVRSST